MAQEELRAFSAITGVKAEKEIIVDEMEVNNPLGAARGHWKLTLGYCMGTLEFEC